MSRRASVARIGRAVLVVGVLGAGLGGVLAAHDNSLNAQRAQTTLVRGSAALERNLAVTQLSTPDEAIQAE